MRPVRDTFNNQLGVWRSLLIYYGIPFRGRRLTQFYKPFIRPGDLCFDIGAHVGNRLRVWRNLGARIVAIEPQPEMMHVLKHLYGRDPQISLRSEAVGAQEGEATLFLSRRTPTVSSLSPEWIEAVKMDSSFSSVEWDGQVTVPVTTLDKLIEEYGRPSFCKIDVEGFELEVLRGLEHPIPGISFEIIPAAIESAHQCIARLAEIGSYHYNFSPGESHQYLFPRWLSSAEIQNQITALGSNDKSGDIYAIWPT